MPYRSWQQWPTSARQTRAVTGSGSIRVINGGGRGYLNIMVKENAVIMFTKRGCCLGHVVKRLLQVVGANPAVYEVEDKEEDSVAAQLGAGNLQFPAVFIGGRWFGGIERIIASHIREELTPLLKTAGALWL